LLFLSLGSLQQRFSLYDEFGIPTGRQAVGPRSFLPDPHGPGDPAFPLQAEINRAEPLSLPHPFSLAQLFFPRKRGTESGGDLPAAPAGAHARMIQPSRRGLGAGASPSAYPRMQLPMPRYVSGRPHFFSSAFPSGRS